MVEERAAATDVSSRLSRADLALVVDSCADLPPVLRGDPNVTMVPLNVHFGDEVFRDWVDIEPAEFYARLRRAPKLPTTSQPSVGTFVQTYRRLRERFPQVLSLHLSSRLSGTFESAGAAANEVDGVIVRDTRSASLGISLLVDRLLQQLDEGASMPALLDYVERYPRESGFLFVVDTLEYLQKGGRIGRASGLAGGLLSIKPLLTLEDGVVDAYKKVRGERKALAEMVQYFQERTTADRPVHLCVLNADNREKADEVVRLLQGAGRQIDLRFHGEAGAVIGTYAGPGAVGIFFVQ